MKFLDLLHKLQSHPEGSRSGLQDVDTDRPRTGEEAAAKVARSKTNVGVALPDELLLNIFGYLDVDAYHALSLVSRQMCTVVRSPELERTMWRNTLGPKAPIAPPVASCNGMNVLPEQIKHKLLFFDDAERSARVATSRTHVEASRP